MKFKVSYTESVLREIEVEAKSEEDAEQKVMDGDVDYDESTEIDATVASVNSVEKIT